jgi:hypothetical protein
MAEQKNKGGRPKKVIDYKIVESLAGVFCTQQEIANILGVSLRTLQNDEVFSHVFKEGHENAKSSLRRFQYKSAQNGNVTMQIWLGKQYLGQTDKQQTEHSFQEVRIVNDAPSQDK